MRHSETIGAIASALAKAQAEYKPVAKGKTASVESKRTGAKFTYNYADLADCLSMALPCLAKNGIGFLQPDELRDGKLRVTTLLIHSSGEWLHSDGIEISEEGDPQQFGAESTYFRRYDGCSFIGVAPDEDTDAQQAGQRTRRTTPAEVTRPISDPRRGPELPEAPPQSERQTSITNAGDFLLSGDKLICVIKGATEKQTKTGKPYLTVTFNGRVDGFNYAFNYHASLSELLKEAVGKTVNLQIAPKKSEDGKSIQYFSIEDVLNIEGVEYHEGKPVTLTEELENAK